MIKQSGYKAENIERDLKKLIALGADAILSLSDRQAIICVQLFDKLNLKNPR